MPSVTGGRSTSGAPGASAYQIWLAAGNQGTQADFLASLRGSAATAQQIAAATASYLSANPPAAGASASDAQISAAVAAWMTAHPPANGQNATDAQIATATASYIADHPPAAGQNATNAQVASAVAAYLTANPPASGTNGTNATNAQVASAVATYMGANPVIADNRIKDAKANLSTNNSGVWTKTYAASFWTAEPSVMVTPRTALMLYAVTKSVTGNAWTITVTFTQLKTSLAVLGALTTAIATPVQFDYLASEATS